MWVDADPRRDPGHRTYIPKTRTRTTTQDERLGALREQVSYLRRQLDEEREARRRADTIIAQLARANEEQARTIGELEAPLRAAVRQARIASDGRGRAGEVQKSPDPATGEAQEDRTEPLVA